MNTARVLAAAVGTMMACGVLLAQPADKHIPVTNKGNDKHEAPGNQPSGTMEAIPVPAGSPLQFETTFHDFGKIPDTEPVTFEYKFKNISDAPVRILKATASCGCTTTKAKEVIEAGEESSITATYNPHGRSGREAKSITVELDHPTVKNIHLTAVAYVQKRVIIEPPALFMGEIAQGKGATQEISISGRDAGFQVTSARMESPFYTLEEIGKDEIEVEGDKLQRFRYRVTLKSEAPIGTQQASATFTTNDTLYPTTQVSAMAQVAGPIRIMPERVPVRFSGESQPFVADVNLEPREARAFKVLSVSVDGASQPMNVVVDVAPGRPGSKALYRIRVAGTTPATMSDIRGGITIKTDMPDQPEIVLPFMPLQVALPGPKPTMQGGTEVKPGVQGTPIPLKTP